MSTFVVKSPRNNDVFKLQSLGPEIPLISHVTSL